MAPQPNSTLAPDLDLSLFERIIVVAIAALAVYLAFFHKGDF